MNARLLSLPLLALLSLSLPAAAAPDHPAVKPVKTLVQAVRYSKDTLALKSFGTEEQGRLLLGEDWSKGTDAQRAEFVKLFQSLFAKIAFPQVRKNFEHLASITYDEPKVEGNQAKLGSIIIIDHPMKKQELKVQYSLVKDKAAWKVVDVFVLGDSTLAGIRDDQIKPIMKEGGWENLLRLMRAKDKELSAKAK